jgi:erythronate-4-phosphate dehydrogenase
VVDGGALEHALDGGRPALAILDVWEGEPSPAPSLVARCALATPHIAGHSLDGKANGTEQIYRAACAVLGAAPSWSARAALPPPASPWLRVDTAARSDEAVVLAALRAAYRLETDDAALRSIVSLPAAERAAAFRHHRDHYPPRRELRAFTVELSPYRERAARILRALGANVR